MAFENPFLSAKGQKERLSNAGKTVLSAITGKGVLQNTKSGQKETVLSKAASNPFGTALVLATAKSPKTALAAVKEAPKTVLATTLLAPAVVSAVASNPKGAAKTAGKAAGFTQDVANFGGNIASIKDGNDVIETVKENPVLSALTVLATGAAVKGGINAVSTGLNTYYLKENTEVSKDLLSNSPLNNTPKDNKQILNTLNPSESSAPKLISGSEIDSRKSSTSTAGGTATLSAPPAVNIQQNNYYGEKYLNKL